VDRWEYIYIAHRHMHVEIRTEATEFPEKGLHEWDFRCSVYGREERGVTSLLLAVLADGHLARGPH
jgi:hypothetical protein